jgi:hypothetical protein
MLCARAESTAVAEVEPVARTVALTVAATAAFEGSVGLAGDWKSDTCGRGEKRAE